MQNEIGMLGLFIALAIGVVSLVSARLADVFYGRLKLTLLILMLISSVAFIWFMLISLGVVPNSKGRFLQRHKVSKYKNYVKLKQDPFIFYYSGLWLILVVKYQYKVTLISLAYSSSVCCSTDGRITQLCYHSILLRVGLWKCLPYIRKRARSRRSILR